ncbi:MAG: hypothetical protein EOM19_02665 [Candidatus Moranbacteria bacterium]|nr:hypothetical protein [Candidatus Moranbacteria bacterium]
MLYSFEQIIVIIFLGIFIGIAFINQDINKGIDLSIVATLLAAFGGTYFAFSLQNQKEFRKEEMRKIDNGNRLLFLLVTLIGFVKNIDLEYLYDENGKLIVGAKFDYLKIRPALSAWNFIDFEKYNLTFVLSKKPNINYNLLLTQEKYNTLIVLLIERSRFHSEVIQKILEIKGINFLNDEIDEREIITLLGPRNYGMIKSMTDDLIDQIKDTDIIVRETFSILRDYLKEEYPKNKFISYEYDDSKKRTK